MNGKQLKNSLLQWAIQGKLVPQDPNDEPASVLLERIRQEKAHLVKEKKIKKEKDESIIYRGEDNSYYEEILATGEMKCIDEEIPFEIPENWVWGRIEDIGEIVTGNTPSKDKPEYYDGNIPFFKPTDLEQEKDVKYSNDHLSVLGFEKARKLPANTILVTCIGTIGKTGIISVEGCCNQQINAIIPNHNVLPYFIYYVCISDYFQCIIKKNASATTISILNRKNFANLLIPLPSLSEQQRIVAKIEELMPYVEKYGKAQEKLDNLNGKIKETLRKSILQEAIQGRLVPQMAEEGSGEELLAQIRQEKERLVKEKKLSKSVLVGSDIFKGDDDRYYEQVGETITCIDEQIPFEIPNSWSVVRLSTLCELIDGEKRSGKSICLDAKYLRGKAPANYLERGKFVKKGDHIILVDGENSGEVFTVPCDGYMGSTFKQLWISEVMSLQYVLYFIAFYKDLLRKSKKGAAIPHLNKNVFYSLLIGIPPKQEQVRIVAKIEELLSLLTPVS